MTLHRRLLAFAICLAIAGVAQSESPHYFSARQGFAMKTQLNNLTGIGSIGFFPGVPGNQVGLEYPIGSANERLIFLAPWIGGSIDTARNGTSPRIKSVTTGYEGWTEPYLEFFPGSSPADTIWQIDGQSAPEPPDWQSYWGFPFSPISDNDFYCTYTDTAVIPSGHIPMGIKVIQSSFVWDDSIAEGIQIIEYKIINMRLKSVDSVFVAFFAQFMGQNSAAFIPPTLLASFSDGVYVGLSLLYTSQPSNVQSYQWFPGSSSLLTDASRYGMISSGVIDPPEFPSDPDTRHLAAWGPFALPSRNDPNPDTLVVAIGIVCCNNQNIDARLELARQIYLSGGIIHHRTKREHGRQTPDSCKITPTRSTRLQPFHSPFLTHHSSLLRSSMFSDRKCGR